MKVHNPKSPRPIGLVEACRLAEISSVCSEVMVCPACNGVNSRANADCYNCGWRGRFITERAAVSEGVRRMLIESPHLILAFVDNPPRKPKFWEWVRTRWVRMRQKR